MIKPFMKGTMKDPPRNPGIEITGPVPVKPERETLPVEELQQLQKKDQGSVPGTGQPTLLLPLMMNPAGGQAAPEAPAGSTPGAPTGSSAPAGTGTGTGH
jgi:hypothetical protein